MLLPVCLFTMGINIQKLYGAILTAMGEAPLQGGASGNTNTGRGPQTRGGAQTSETPALDQYSRDLTELAREGKLDPVVGRGQEIERVIQILSRRTKNQPVSDRRAGCRKNGDCGRSGAADCPWHRAGNDPR